MTEPADREAPVVSVRPDGLSWRWWWIFGVTFVLGVAAQTLDGWRGWLIFVSGLGLGYFVAATEVTS